VAIVDVVCIIHMQFANMKWKNCYIFLHGTQYLKLDVLLASIEQALHQQVSPLAVHILIHPSPECNLDAISPSPPQLARCVYKLALAASGVNSPHGAITTRYYLSVDSAMLLIRFVRSDHIHLFTSKEGGGSGGG
jgi:hypothetical protein